MIGPGAPNVTAKRVSNASSTGLRIAKWLALAVFAVSFGGLVVWTLGGWNIRPEGNKIITRLQAYRAEHGVYPRLLSDVGIASQGSGGTMAASSSTDDGWTYSYSVPDDSFMLWKRVSFRNSHYYVPGKGWTFCTSD